MAKNIDKDEKYHRRQLIFKEDTQEYAQVTKMLGNGNLEAKCFDGLKRLCHIQKKLEETTYIDENDIILVDLSHSIADVVLKYTPNEAERLKSLGELPKSVRINSVASEDDGYDGELEFGYDMRSAKYADDEAKNFKRDNKLKKKRAATAQF